MGPEYQKFASYAGPGTPLESDCLTWPQTRRDETKRTPGLETPLGDRRATKKAKSP